MKKQPTKKKRPNGTSFAGTPVSMEVHQEYIQYHDKVNLKEFSDAELKRERDKLLRKKVSLEEKRKLLFLLAHNKSLWALYGIQKYLKTSEPELAGFAELAWQECQAGVLNSALEKIGFGEEEESVIMGGLGGEGQKLRYCFAVSVEKSEFSEKDKTLLNTMLQHIAHGMKANIEEAVFSRNYLRVVTLIPMDIAVGDFIESVIDRSNASEYLLRQHYFVVNTHILSDKEIEDYIKEITGD